ncbi:MAG: hypothetical protein JO002_01840, partial [Burkholderiaceae bacterium]|nr:hypothetical protein [Burkholderiaceae bacterium]
LSDGNSPWLEKPELVEIKANSLGQGRDAKRVVDFSMNVAIKRPRDAEKAGDKAAPGAKTGDTANGPASTTAAAPGAPAAPAPAPNAVPAAAGAASAPKKP